MIKYNLVVCYDKNLGKCGCICNSWLGMRICVYMCVSVVRRSGVNLSLHVVLLRLFGK